MNPAIIEHLLKFKPFKRFYLVTVSKKEYDITQAKQIRILGELETLVWSEDGTTDFIDLKLIEHIRIDDDFGFVELEQMLK